MKWPIKKLSELSELITKGTTPTSLGFSYASSGVRFLRAQNINYGNVNFYDNDLYIDVGTHNALARSQIKNGDLLVSIAGSIGRSGIVVLNNEPLNCNQAVAIVRLKKEVNEKYISHVLDSQALKNQIRSSTVTGVISNLSLSQLGNLTIPLPPLAEQQRIAALLDTADRILKLRESAIAKLDQLAQSVFVDMFSKHIKKLQLKDTCSFISGGTPSKDEPKFWNGDVAWISSADIEGDHVKEIRHFVTESAINNSATNPILPNNILVVTRTGVGKVVVTDRKFCFSQDITGLVLKKEFKPEFLAASIRSKQDEIVKQARGATIKGVTRDVIANVEIPAASILEQQIFSERILQIDSVKKNYEIDRIKIDVLLSSLQHQSFAVN